jgi:hypothetical protein
MDQNKRMIQTLDMFGVIVGLLAGCLILMFTATLVENAAYLAVFVVMAWLLAHRSIKPVVDAWRPVVTRLLTLLKTAWGSFATVLLWTAVLAFSNKQVYSLTGGAEISDVPIAVTLVSLINTIVFAVAGLVAVSPLLFCVYNPPRNHSFGDRLILFLVTAFGTGLTVLCAVVIGVLLVLQIPVAVAWTNMHTDPKRCSNVTDPKLKITPLRDDYVLIAVPIGNSYEFRREKCLPFWS